MKNKPIPFLPGQKYARLTIVERVKGKDRRFLCRCDCGNMKEVSGQNLRNKDPLKRVMSCGCLKAGRPARLRHGHCVGGKQSPTRISWNAMRLRCNNPKSVSYPAYGGRGIKIDPRWNDFANFLEDMGERPEGTTLDRIDVNGDYTKDNCRWATKEVQTTNRRKYTLITVSRLRELEAIERRVKELGIEL